MRFMGKVRARICHKQIVKGKTMIELNAQEIARRLDKVEKQNRTMKLAGIVFISVVAVSLVAGAAKKSEATKEIKAHRIVMVDSKGKERIVMEEHASEVPKFEILDTEGRSMFRTIIMAGVLLMESRTEQGKRRLEIITGEDSSSFSIYGKNDVEQISCTARDFATTLYMTSPNQESYLNLGCLNSGSLIVAGRKGFKNSKVFINGGEKDSTGGGITITNKTGEEVVQLHADEYGNGVVGSYNRKGMGRTLKPGT